MQTHRKCKRSDEVKILLTEAIKKWKENRKLQKARLTNDRTQELREITPDRNRQN